MKASNIRVLSLNVVKFHFVTKLFILFGHWVNSLLHRYTEFYLFKAHLYGFLDFGNCE